MGPSSWTARNRWSHPATSGTDSLVQWMTCSGRVRSPEEWPEGPDSTRILLWSNDVSFWESQEHDRSQYGVPQRGIRPTFKFPSWHHRSACFLVSTCHSGVLIIKVAVCPSEGLFWLDFSVFLFPVSVSLSGKLPASFRKHLTLASIPFSTLPPSLFMVQTRTLALRKAHSGPLPRIAVSFSGSHVIYWTMGFNTHGIWPWLFSSQVALHCILLSGGTRDRKSRVLSIITPGF